jgi:glutamine amidotransferase
MRVAIVDYGSGNLHSAAKAFERAARDHDIRAEILVTKDAELVRQASRIVLPGVGAFKDCRNGLKATLGMWDVLQEEVIEKGKPFLGICVGMQLMASRGLEHEVTDGLGWIAGDVSLIETGSPLLKIPHMGWNTLEHLRAHPLLDGIALGPQGLHAYFVHSYHLVPRNERDVIAMTEHGIPVTAIVGRDNMAGTQFHPEKSQTLGLQLIANFLEWRP